MTSSIPSMEFASSTSKLPVMYDVLINFNGGDIQRKFVSHLDSALSAVGLTTFLHHQDALNPMNIQQPILNLCRVAIVVFTKTYSQSAWCLHQLQQIIEWHQTYCRHVLPVYYEIQPSDVRLQKGDFGKAFKATAHQTFSGQQLEDVMSSWSNALTKAANFFGWDESNHRSDAELVDKIVKSVINLPVLSATKFPVGLQSYIEDVIRSIKNKSTEVHMIGITGEGGSGKTTLAKAIYLQIHGTFEEKSYITEDITQIEDTSRLEKLLQTRFSDKRALIVLDDVTKVYPWLDLGIYLSAGSVLIIATRDERQLERYGVDSVFPIQLMDENESLELLSWHAFREAKPKEEYNDLAKEVAAYCGGLPLALEVIGSSLFERTKEEWNSVLFKLAKIPQDDVGQKLKISFDGLCNEMEKDLFLDVCCFFVGKGRAYVTKILNGCGVDADTGIRVLMERSLIKVKKNNKLGMHPLLQEMGITIIFEISGKKPGKNSRLRFDKDAQYVLREITGTEFIERFPVQVPSVRRDWFDLHKVVLAVNPEYLFQKLRWIIVHDLYSEYPHNNFYVHDAIAIDLKHSGLLLFWEEPQVLRWLKVLNLSHSRYLTETPDFSRLPSLEHLILKDCPRLCEVHHSIGCLYNLTLLNLKDCTSLSNLPIEVYKLKSLKTLILSGCSMIDLLEKDIMQMESLITLIAENTAVKQAPFSIVSSKSIGYISLRGFEGLSHNLFPSIIRSWISPTVNPLSYIHSFCMDMEDNSWDDIAPLLSTLAKLRSFLVQCNTEFQLSKLVKNILVEYFANITESRISTQHFRSSSWIAGAYHPASDYLSEVLASSASCDVSIPGDNDPYLLVHMGEGHSVSFTVPPDRDIKGMAFCVIYSSIPEIVATECLRSVLIVNYTKCTLHIHNHGRVISFNDKDWHDIISNLGSGDNVEIFVTFGRRLVVKNIAVYLICSKSNVLEKEPARKKNSLLRFIKKIVTCVDMKMIQ